jgi:hypothetical protein
MSSAARRSRTRDAAPLARVPGITGRLHWPFHVDQAMRRRLHQMGPRRPSRSAGTRPSVEQSCGGGIRPGERSCHPPRVTAPNRGRHTSECWAGHGPDRGGCHEPAARFDRPGHFHDRRSVSTVALASPDNRIFSTLAAQQSRAPPPPPPEPCLAPRTEAGPSSSRTRVEGTRGSPLEARSICVPDWGRVSAMATGSASSDQQPWRVQSE